MAQSLEQTKMDVAPDTNQKLVFNIGTGPAIQPNSVELEIPVESGDIWRIAGNVNLRDMPVNSTIGNLVNERGQVQGTITYATGVVEVTPRGTGHVFTQEFAPVRLENIYTSA